MEAQFFEARFIDDRDLSSIAAWKRARKIIEEAFFGEEPITQTEINAFTDSLIQAAQEWKERHPEEAIVILELLHDWLEFPHFLARAGYKILNATNFSEIEVLSTHGTGQQRREIIDGTAIDAELRRIRAAIQQRLRVKEVTHIHLTRHPKKTGLKARSLRQLHSDYVLKQFDDREGDMDAKKEALKKLYSLKERSKFLLYPTVLQDSDSDQHIRRKIDFLTLPEWLNTQAKPALKQVLRSIDQIIQGLMFLHEHHLSLMDLDPSNIGVSKDGSTCFLFDYDGLRLETTRLNNYLAKGIGLGMEGDFIPPERCFVDEGFDPESPLGEADAVFEMGVTLKNILKQYFSEDRSLTANWLTDYIIQMTGVRNHRPDLEDVHRFLGMLILTFEENEEMSS